MLYSYLMYFLIEFSPSVRPEMLSLVHNRNILNMPYEHMQWTYCICKQVRMVNLDYDMPHEILIDHFWFKTDLKKKLSNQGQSKAFWPFSTFINYMAWTLGMVLTLSHGPLTSCKSPSSGKMPIRGIFYWFLSHLQSIIKSSIVKLRWRF